MVLGTTEDSHPSPVLQIPKEGIAEAVIAASVLLSSLLIHTNSFLSQACHAPGGSPLPKGACLANTQGRPGDPGMNPQKQLSTNKWWVSVACASQLPWLWVG